MIKAVEKPIDSLKPEIGHADVIVVGINQDNADFSAPLLSNGSDLGFNWLPSRFSGFSYHVAGCRLQVGRCM